MSDEKLLDIERYAESAHFDRTERLALAVAERMTIAGADVSDELFERLKVDFTAEQIVELICTIAFENFLSKFHRVLRVDSQGFCPIPTMRPVDC